MKPLYFVQIPAIRYRGKTIHDVKKLLVKIPLHMLICVTGVSGSGESTLIEKTL